ncbi:MAG: phosphopantetheine-binding protein [Elusimicrobiota bacterium]|jgi:acyl carrier protein|nr:phosphopantetheine-binding protein [Elusimicrobiota bacterium]
MNHKEIFDNIKKIIFKIKKNLTCNISEEDNLADDLGLSSFEMLIFVQNLNSKLKINISDKDIRENLKIQNLINFILKLK